MIYIFVTLLIIVIVFCLLHLRPLENSEVLQLANKRRLNEVYNYFYFEKLGMQVKPEFKKRMNPNGSFYEMDEMLNKWPDVAAGLLKYKKHEWIIISFEANRMIKLVWLNKGFDRGAVASYLDELTTTNIANENGYTSVLIFHNHPNPDPRKYDCSKPSNQDIVSAKHWGDTLSIRGVNLLEFVCEKGRYYQYAQYISDRFLPIKDYVYELNRRNDKSKANNLLLHIERIFL